MFNMWRQLYATIVYTLLPSDDTVNLSLSACSNVVSKLNFEIDHTEVSAGFHGRGGIESS